MTIRKGEEWGTAGRVPQGTVRAETDRELFEIVNRSVLPPCIALVRGDLARTVSAGGGRSIGETGSEAVLAPIDLCLATHDGGAHRFAVHAVARRSWWRGPVFVAANAQFLGRWDVAPRSHPNDGYLDITEVSERMGVQQRVAAWRRLPTAGHLPHPAIRTQRMRSGSWTFDRPMRLWLDGVPVGRTRTLTLEVIPDAAQICF